MGTDLNEFWLKVYDTAEDNVTPPPNRNGQPLMDDPNDVADAFAETAKKVVDDSAGCGGRSIQQDQRHGRIGNTRPSLLPGEPSIHGRARKITVTGGIEWPRPLWRCSRPRELLLLDHIATVLPGSLEATQVASEVVRSLRQGRLRQGRVGPIGDQTGQYWLLRGAEIAQTVAAGPGSVRRHRADVRPDNVDANRIIRELKVANLGTGGPNENVKAIGSASNRPMACFRPTRGFHAGHKLRWSPERGLRRQSRIAQPQLWHRPKSSSRGPSTCEPTESATRGRRTARWGA